MAGLVIALFVLAVVGGVAGAMAHAQLVANRNHCDEAWANVTAELQRRHQLIPELIEAASAGAAHERQLLTEVTALTAEAVRLTEQNDASDAHEAIEAKLEAGVQKIIIRIERQPELRTDQHYLELHHQLVTTADRVQSVLRFYNSNVRAYNNSVRQFPSRIVAAMSGSKPLEYFRITDTP
ncbi:MAG: LemA family protein [Actinomycetota bacterium]